MNHQCSIKCPSASEDMQTHKSFTSTERLSLLLEMEHYIVLRASYTGYYIDIGLVRREVDIIYRFPIYTSAGRDFVVLTADDFTNTNTLLSELKC